VDLIAKVRRIIERLDAPVIPTDIVAVDSSITPREALHALRNIAQRVEGGWTTEEDEMAVDKAALLAKMMASKQKKGGAVVPKDAPEPDLVEEEIDEDEDEEDEEEEAAYDLAKPVAQWKVDECSAYLAENSLPSTGKVKELRKLVAMSLKMKEAEPDEEEVEAEKAAAESVMQKKLAKAKAATKKVTAPEPEPEPEEDQTARLKRKLAAKKAAEPKPEPKAAEPKPEPKAAEPKPEPKAAEPKPEPRASDWGVYTLCVDCAPTRLHEGEVVYLSDLLEEARDVVARSDEPQRKTWMQGLTHWNSVDYNRGASMVAAVFREMLNQGLVSVDGCVVVCNSRDPGQAEVVENVLSYSASERFVRLF
jgi:hypothetical protein